MSQKNSFFAGKETGERNKTEEEEEDKKEEGEEEATPGCFC